jgi:Cu-Zn family superoxide dismutase
MTNPIRSTSVSWFPVVALALAILSPASARAETAQAELKGENGAVVGHATLEETPLGVLLHVEFTGLPAGTHAFHIHAVGKCEPPFTSAGGHLNPSGKQHGFKNAAGMHAGDLPNITVPPGGSLTVDAFAPGVTFKELFDADGSTLMVHAGPDDYTSDPAGNAGARIACGVITKGSASAH